jgi:hypothetical protein
MNGQWGILRHVVAAVQAAQAMPHQGVEVLVEWPNRRPSRVEARQDGAGGLVKAGGAHKCAGIGNPRQSHLCIACALIRQGNNVLKQWELQGRTTNRVMPRGPGPA